MSYILEALKKSEQERQRGNMPGLQTVQTSALRPEPRGRALWPYLLLTALFLNACLLMWWLRPWQPVQQSVNGSETDTLKAASRSVERGKLVPGAEAQSPPSLLEHAGRGVSSPERGGDKTVSSKAAPNAAGEKSVGAHGIKEKTAGLPQKAPRESTPAANGRVDKESNRQAPKLPHVAKLPSGAVSGSSKVPPMAVSTSSDSSKDLAPETRKTEERSAHVPTRKESLMDKEISPADEKPHTAVPIETERRLSTAALQTTDNRPQAPLPQVVDEQSIPSNRSSIQPSSLASTKPDLEQTVPNFSELSFSAKAAIPQISISMLVHSKNPSQRMINVNGKTMHEGEEVVPGLRLEQITRNGAIFSYKGHRFHKGVF